MKIKYYDRLKNRLAVSERVFIFFVFFSLFYLVGWFMLLVPVFQNLIIMFGEFLVHRQLNHPVWRGRFILWGLSGIVLYVLFFTVFFLESSRGKENFGRKIYISVSQLL
jgi:uncharacterized BrkB/YihY/UPF0761 family membrane protein